MLTLGKQIVGGILVTVSLFASVGDGLAKELLFQAEPADNGYASGVGRKLAEAYRTEFDPRMFPHRTWHQRLAYSSDDNETLEITPSRTDRAGSAIGGQTLLSREFLQDALSMKKSLT